MKIYHGSEKIVKNPLLKLGKPNNDFGKGFYCTNDIEKAKEWACKNNRSGIVNIYELKEEGLKVLDLTDTKYSVLNWISILLNNRTFNIDNPIALRAKDFLIKNYSIKTNNYDIIIGYRADDSYFSYASSFVENSLSYESLQKAMQLGNLGKQIVLVSDKAFINLKYINCILANKNEYYAKYKSNDIAAREAYKNIKSLDNEIYVIDIIRRGNKK